jgi:hypothetical protein
MAKPRGGGTLTALFEVSDQERQAFYDRVQKQIAPSGKSNSTSGTPKTGIPETGAPQIGIPGGDLSELTPIIIRNTSAGTSPSIVGVPDTGVPEAAIPKTGMPQIGTPETSIPKVKGAIGNPALRLRIKRAAQVQDGHSLGEQKVLETLWKEADQVPGQVYRRITIGYRTLSGLCGLTVNNCKANLRSLLAKLALEPEVGYSNTMATTYRVYGFSDILRRREAAGMTHVLRSRGSLFVHPETGVPLLGAPPTPVSGIPIFKTGVPVSDEKSIPEAGTHLGSKK